MFYDMAHLRMRILFSLLSLGSTQNTPGSTCADYAHIKRQDSGHTNNCSTSSLFTAILINNKGKLYRALFMKFLFSNNKCHTAPPLNSKRLCKLSRPFCSSVQIKLLTHFSDSIRPSYLHIYPESFHL